MTITIEPLATNQKNEAVQLLARAFVTNPLHIAIFGADRLDRNEAFFHRVFAVMKGQQFAAVDGSRILGIIHWIDSTRCQVPFIDKLWMAPSMFRELGLRSTIRVVRWVSIWSKYDPREHHLHLGPIGVLPEAQGHGVGRQLMERYCNQLDTNNAIGYLETDRPRNVDFYMKFGFEVTETTSIYGVTNYFMYRRPGSTRPG
jgi:GNAT superfamily N-acetyltransferase